MMIPPNFRSFGILFLGVLSTAVPCGAQIVMTASDPSGSSSFNSAGTWSVAAAPSSGHTYADTDFVMRTPATAGNFTFAGDSLTINGEGSAVGETGGSLVFKGITGIITINSLFLNNSIVSNFSGTPSSFTLAGNITLQSGGGIFDTNANAPITVTANIGGVGKLSITAAGAGSQVTNPVVLSGANTYQGGTTVGAVGTAGSFAYLDVQAAGALGTGNVTVLGGRLKLELGTSSNYIANTANLVLSNALATGAIGLDFTGTDSIAGLSLDGGATFAAAGTWGAPGSGAQFTSSVFEGAGELAVSAVPEPKTMALLGMGLGLLAVTKRIYQAP